MTLYAKPQSAGGAWRDGQGDYPLWGGQVDLGALGRLGQGDRSRDLQAAAAATEDRVRGDVHREQQIARVASTGGRVALTAEPNLLAVLDAGGDLHGDGVAAVAAELVSSGISASSGMSAEVPRISSLSSN